MSNIEVFQRVHPSSSSYWRSIILFGKNVAAYKLALAKSLLEIVPTEKTVVTYEELAVPFSKHLCEHIANAPKQTTSRSSQVLEACKNYNNGIITHDELLDITVKKGFNDVIKRFHVVNQYDIPVKFYDMDNGKRTKKIVLTDEIFGLLENQYSDCFLKEAEARWNLVEKAWELGVSTNLLNIQYNDDSQSLFVDDKRKRKDVTSARAALNGYQKGKCFYCFDDISIGKGNENICNVDHFYPHVLKQIMPDVNIDGVWNLVLACPNCNKGRHGKFAHTPALKYLERLSKRNEFLISSHHPLRETLMQQTGSTQKMRHDFLQRMDNYAVSHFAHRWETEQIGEEVF